MLYAIELGAPIDGPWELDTDEQDRMILRVRARVLTPRLVALINHLNADDPAPDELNRGPVPRPRDVPPEPARPTGSVGRGKTNLITRIIEDACRQGRSVIIIGEPSVELLT
ncbi:hypothetical protein [Amycolatopsis sp. NPDC059657]|uniref:hypothetical protein n=1 Tax=Amycolatopsis sp. NPDC059657 TaxID=3346899 RepID=UPI00366FD3C2